MNARGMGIEDLRRIGAKHGYAIDASMDLRLGWQAAFEIGQLEERERIARMLRAEGWLYCATMVEGRSE